MPKYLVTGGAGFIGSNIVDALLGAGDKVTVYDDFSTGLKKNVFDWNPKDVKVVEGDVRDAKSLVKVAKGCDYLLHFAAIPGVTRSVDDPGASDTVRTSSQPEMRPVSDIRTAASGPGSNCQFQRSDQASP